MPPKIKKYGRVQRGQPLFAPGQSIPGSFSFGKIPQLGVLSRSQITITVALTFIADVSSPTGSPSLLPKACGANGDQANSAEKETDIGITDNSETFEMPWETARKSCGNTPQQAPMEPRETLKQASNKRSRPSSARTNEPSKKLLVVGGRPAIAKPVTADLDSDDAMIVAMKRSGHNPKQIADRLRKEGRINYKEKTITSRYARIVKAQAAAMETQAASEPVQWQEDDLEALAQAVAAVDKKLQIETEKLTQRKWQMVVSRLRVLRPAGIFSKADCERRFKELAKHNSQPSRPHTSDPQPGKSGVSQDTLDSEFCSSFSPPPPGTGNCLGRNPNDESSGDGDDEREGEGTQSKAGYTKKNSSPTSKGAGPSAAIETAITWNAAAYLESCDPGALPANGYGSGIEGNQVLEIA